MELCVAAVAGFVDGPDNALLCMRVSHICMSSAGTVFNMIFKSRNTLFVRVYSMSSWIILINVVLFFPLTCHSPVKPGAALKRSICHGWYFAAS